jgi:hypothetical protein
MTTKDYLNYRLTGLKKEVPVLKKKVNNIQSSISSFDTELDTFVSKIDTLSDAVEGFYQTLTNKYERQIGNLNRQIETLQKKLSKEQPQHSGPASVVLQKAKTIAIFDSILSAITSWSQAGDLASDVEAAIQSVLFPSVYERVMSGSDPAYLLPEVPDTAEAVVYEGRQYVKWIRHNCDVAITDPQTWSEHAPEIQKWVTTNALPLIYGEADPEWDEDVPYTLDQILTWRNNPADRMIAFPKIHDAMEIYSKNRQEVMETTNIRQFNLDTSKTRLS